MTDMREVSCILEMEVMRNYDERTLDITQAAYVDHHSGMIRNAGR